MGSIPLKWRLYSFFHIWYGRTAMLGRKGGKKIFCIGLNKTGTTSWAQAMTDLGYQVGNERAAEIFLDDWAQKKYSRILRFCDSAQAFQDVPFSLPGMYQILHRRFPDSRFVLTIRDSPQQWYRSMTRFHARAWSADGNCPPTRRDLENAQYIYKGWPAAFCLRVFQTPPDDPYNRDMLLTFYKGHAQSVCEYFSKYPGSLLQVNVGAPRALQKMCAFLGTPYAGGEFPWKNRMPK
jgi:hypothetical protein